MMSSDSQAMGRVGEVITRTWQTAHKMKVQRGALPEDDGARNDNFRAQALHREVHDQPGAHARHRARSRLDRGRQARRSRAVAAGVLRREAVADHQRRHDRRGADGRPERVDSHAAAGPLPADVRRARPRGRAHLADVRLRRPHSRRASTGASGSRNRSSPSATRAACARPTCGLNNYTPKIEVDPENYQVRADGILLTCEPARVLPLAQRYFLF